MIRFFLVLYIFIGHPIGFLREDDARCEPGQELLRDRREALSKEKEGAREAQSDFAFFRPLLEDSPS